MADVCESAADADVILVNSTGFDDDLMARITKWGCPGLEVSD